MTPGGRAAAAIELLGRLETGAAPVDRAIAGYFRGRRYAGSKDRASVSGLVYGVLRRRAELEWRLGQAGADCSEGAGRARRLVLAQIVTGPADERLEPDEVFNGEGHAPAPLDEEEKRAVAALAGAHGSEPPPWAAGNFPQWLEPDLAQAFGADLVPEMAALNGRAPLDLRVNTVRTDRRRVLERLAGDRIDAAPCPYSPTGVRLAERPRITGHALYRDGHVEVQDEGSQLVALLADARPGAQVIDLCAGAGGKALAMAARMANRGQVFACDSDNRRLARLTPRRARASARNIQTHRLTGAADPWLAAQAGRADRVLVDAPCSGSGAWRRNPDAKWRLTPEALADLIDTQRRLLRAGACLVKPGGRLIFATCSVLRRENEDHLDAFLAAHDNFSLVPVARVWAESVGGVCPTEADVLTLTPHRTGTDGFFVAIFEHADA